MVPGPSRSGKARPRFFFFFSLFLVFWQSSKLNLLLYFQLLLNLAREPYKTKEILWWRNITYFLPIVVTIEKIVFTNEQWIPCYLQQQVYAWLIHRYSSVGTYKAWEEPTWSSKFHQFWIRLTTSQRIFQPILWDDHVSRGLVRSKPTQPFLYPKCSTWITLHHYQIILITCSIKTDFNHKWSQVLCTHCLHHPLMQFKCRSMSWVFS